MFQNRLFIDFFSGNDIIIKCAVSGRGKKGGVFMSGLFAWIKSLFMKLITFLRLRGVGPVVADFEDPSVPEPPFDAVCYYGCPNSNKAKKLQLGKKALR